MAYELFTADGKRKYLNAEELDRFIEAAKAQERPEVRTLCLVLAHTGCRIYPKPWRLRSIAWT